MNKTALVYSKEEALEMEPSKRPLCYRVPSGIYHDTFEAMGAASTCSRNEGEFQEERLEALTVGLLFKIANTLEEAGIVYETWPENWK